MPDYFVPLDTTKYTKFHRQISAKGLVINANLRYIDANRKSLRKEYKSFDDFRKRFEVPRAVTDSIIAEARRQKIEPKDSAELEQTLPYLKMQLKGLVARDLWDMSEYFAIMNEYSDIVRKAIVLLENKEIGRASCRERV